MREVPAVIRSMTGFGSASIDTAGVRYALEIRTVNSKYFKCLVRVPEGLEEIEAPIEEAVRRKIQRGTVTVTAAMTQTAPPEALEVNAHALSQYLQRLQALRIPQGVSVSLDIGALLALPNVLVPPADGQARSERIRQVFLDLVDRAASDLIAMREAEGRSMLTELRAQIASIRQRLGEIAALAPGVVAQYEQRLMARIASLLADAGAQAEPADIVREVASYAERTDINEEISRLGAHLDQFESLTGSDDIRPVGRTLDFLAQELLREANTIASKTPDAQVSRLVVEIKGSIDRVKELVQNVE